MYVKIELLQTRLEKYVNSNDDNNKKCKNVVLVCCFFAYI